MCYIIDKKKYNCEVLSLDYSSIDGYKITPKNKIYDAIEVNKMTIVKLDFIKKLLKKKVRLMLETLDEDTDSGDNRKALSHVERYRKIINEKYSKFLDNKYITLLNQKIDILEREFKNDLIKEKEVVKEENIKESILKEELKMQEQYEIQDEIEHENRRRR